MTLFLTRFYSGVKLAARRRRINTTLSLNAEVLLLIAFVSCTLLAILRRGYEKTDSFDKSSSSLHVAHNNSIFDVMY